MPRMRGDSTLEFSACASLACRPPLGLDAGVGRASDLVEPAGQLRARPDRTGGVLIGATGLQYRKIVEQRTGDLQPDGQPVDQAARDRAGRVLGQIERRSIGRPAPGNWSGSAGRRRADRRRPPESAWSATTTSRSDRKTAVRPARARRVASPPRHTAPGSPPRRAGTVRRGPGPYSVTASGVCARSNAQNAAMASVLEDRLSAIAGTGRRARRLRRVRQRPEPRARPRRAPPAPARRSRGSATARLVCP